MRLLLPLLLTGLLCFAGKSDVDYDESVDFSRFRTFAIRQGRVNSNKPQLNDPLTKTKIENAIREQLKAKGLEETSARPSLIVNWRLGAQDKRDVERVSAGPRGWRTRTLSRRYTEGTLVIDLLDASSRSLVFRSIYTDEESDAGKLDRKLAGDVQKALGKFPPKKK